MNTVTVDYNIIKEEADGVLAEFDSSAELLKAARRIREEGGYTKYDCYSPFPIHGMDDAMGLKQSPLGKIVFGIGLLGFVGGTTMEWWMSAIDYPLVYAGKPLFSLPAFIPIMFEITVLISAFTAVFGMLALNKLPKYFHPAFHSDRFVAKATDNGFFAIVYAWDKNFDADKLQFFMKNIGGKNIEIIHRPTEEIINDRSK